MVETALIFAEEMDQCNGGPICKRTIMDLFKTHFSLTEITDAKRCEL